MRRSSDGFTLIEILIVIGIIVLLMSGVMLVIPWVGRKKDEAMTRALLAHVEALLAQAENPDNLGEYPPTRTADLRLGTKKVGKEIAPQYEINEGSETVAIVVFMDGLVLGGRIETKDLANVDDDVAANQWTIHKKLDLFEIVDAWGNPLIYIHHRDYGQEFLYSMEAEEYGPGRQQLSAGAWKDDKTDTYYRLESYQLYSAGPDGIPNTDDDIATFR